MSNNAYIKTNTNYNISAPNVSITGNLAISNTVSFADGFISGNLTVDGNLVYVNVNSLSVEDPVIALGRGPNNTPLITNDGKDRGEQLWYYKTSEQSAFIGWQNSTGKIIAASDVSLSNDIVTVNSYGNFVVGNLDASIVSASSNIAGGNLITSGLISSAGNITSSNLLTGGTVSATSTITGGNIATGGTVSSTGNITGGNLRTTGSISSTGNITGGNINGGANVYATTHTGSTVSASGNITGGNLLTGGTVSSTGNVQAGNLRTTGVVSATGNITGGNIFGSYFIGDGSGLTGIATLGNLIASGASNVSIPFASGNVTTSVGGNANILVASTAGLYVSGINSVSGNVTGGNLLTGGLISATGNISGSTIVGTTFSGNLVGTTASLSANVTGGNLLTGGLISSTGNITGANVITAGTTYINYSTSAQGNIQFSDGTSIGTITGVGLGSSLLSGARSINLSTNGTGNIGFFPNNSEAGRFTTAGLSITGITSASGNITGGNILTGGLISATGNITSGNINTGNLSLSGSVLGSVLTVTGNVSGGNLVTAGQVSATGSITGANITGANLLTSGKISATGNVVGNGFYSISTYSGAFTDGTVVDYITGNGRISVGAADGLNIYNGGVANTLIASFNTVGALTLGTTGTANITLGNILNGGANGVGNIGTSTTHFNTVFALATSAQYADLAELYAADANYEPGTVLEFGGPQEVTITKNNGTTRVAGVVSTNPSYLMNDGLQSEFPVAVALQGRVPTKVKGTVAKGDLLVASIGGFAVVDNNAKAGTILGKALEDFNGSFGVIEVVVGRC